MSPKLLAFFTAVMLVLTGCSRDIASDTYTTSSTGGKVLEGEIISARHVKIKDHDKLQDNTLGGLAGGAGGAVGGASIGNGTGSIATSIGGAIIGAVAGAYVQDALSTTDGMEYLVKLDEKYIRDADSRTKKMIKESGKASVRDDMKMSIDTNTQTDIISVVQKADPVLAEGSRVYVVYHDDRARLEPIHTAEK